jgi:pimeloyl-ACP methyl ester carboxylesterase
MIRILRPRFARVCPLAGSLLLLLAGCTDTGGDDDDTTTPEPEVPYEVPAGATAGWYEPLVEVTTFPDDFHTADEADSYTGLVVDIQPEAEAWMRASMPEGFNIVDGLETLDGFGTTAGIILRFTGPLDTTTVHDGTTNLVALDDGAAQPFEVEWTDDGATAIVYPLFPLEPGRQYGLVMSREVLDADGEPVWAAPALHELLSGEATDPRLARLHDRYAALLAATDLDTDEVAAATVFTTQSIHEEDHAVAAVLESAAPEIRVEGPCEPTGTVLLCPAVLTADDFLDEDQHFSLEFGATPVAQRRYELPLNIYVPDDGAQGPRPVIVYGHGLGGDRGEGRGFASQVAELGLAVAALDAPSHNDHPTNPDAYELYWIFQFFGLGLEGTLDVLQMRDHWRQAAWDKLQLVAAIRDGVDLDGDGSGDLDGDRIYYSGHSLGGIMGAHLLALEPRLIAAELSVPGGRVGDIVYRGEIFAPLVALMSPDGTGEGDLARFFPMMQAAIERGDASNWAPRVLTGDCDVLMTMVIDDGIIPNECNRSLARAFGVQHAPPILQEIEGLEPSSELPVAGNLDGRTGVLYQYDEKLQGSEFLPADHEDAQDNDLADAQLRHWWRTVLEQELGEVVDPYGALGD